MRSGAAADLTRRHGSGWPLCSARVCSLNPSTGLRRRHVVGQQHFNGEADSFSLEDAVSVVESQNICANPNAASAPKISVWAWWALQLTHRLLAVRRSAIRPLAPGERCIAGWATLPASERPSSIRPFCPSETPRNRCRHSPWRTATCTGQNEKDPLRFRWELRYSELPMLDWPQNTAREQDLIVQLLGGPTFDYGALLVVHVNVVPHVVRGGNRTDVVDLQPTTAETSQDIVSEKPIRILEEGREIKERVNNLLWLSGLV